MKPTHAKSSHIISITLHEIRLPIFVTDIYNYNFIQLSVLYNWDMITNFIKHKDSIELEYRITELNMIHKNIKWDSKDCFNLNVIV